MMRELFSLAPPLPMEMLAAVDHYSLAWPATVAALKCGARQEARASSTGRDACPTIFRFLIPAVFLSATLSTLRVSVARERSGFPACQRPPCKGRPLHFQ